VPAVSAEARCRCGNVYRTRTRLAIEVTSSLAALWRLRWDADEKRREAAERRTIRAIGLCFLLLAAYVLYGAAEALIQRRAPEQTTVPTLAVSKPSKLNHGRLNGVLDRDKLEQVEQGWGCEE